MEGTSSRIDRVRQSVDIGELFRTMFWFAMLGPPIGLFGALVASFFIVGPVALVAVAMLPFAYLVVGLPALVTGFLFYFARLLLGRTEWALLAAAAAGAAMTWLWFSQVGTFPGIGLVSLVGAATAAMLAEISARRNGDLGAWLEQKPEPAEADTEAASPVRFTFGTAFAASATWLVAFGG
jgi:hypothetical protein